MPSDEEERIKQQLRNQFMEMISKATLTGNLRIKNEKKEV
jgi:hypothetical protein